MGGKVLEYEAKTNFLKGKAEGRAEAKLEEKALQANNLIKKLNYTIDQAMDFVEVTPDIRPIVLEMLAKM